jgi:hypothetical protein
MADDRGSERCMPCHSRLIGPIKVHEYELQRRERKGQPAPRQRWEGRGKTAMCVWVCDNFSFVEGRFGHPDAQHLPIQYINTPSSECRGRFAERHFLS